MRKRGFKKFEIKGELLSVKSPEKFESTVTSTVDKGIQSYSDSVKQKTSDELIPPVILNKTVKEVVEQKDWSTM